MKYAWIEADKIRDICHADPSECYHPDVAKFYDTKVPDDAENGDGWIDGNIVKPEPAPPTPPPPRMWTADDIRQNLTLSEKVKWDNDALPEIITAKQELTSPKDIDEATEIVAMLVVCKAISSASADKILNILSV